MSPVPTHTLTIGVLGPMRARLDERDIDLAGPGRRAVLARLVLARGSVVSTDLLIEELWSGEPPPQSAGSPRNCSSVPISSKYCAYGLKGSLSASTECAHPPTTGCSVPPIKLKTKATTTAIPLSLYRSEGVMFMVDSVAHCTWSPLGENFRQLTSAVTRNK